MAKSFKGHLEALPPPKVNAGYRFGNPTFAGTYRSYRIAAENGPSVTAVELPEIEP